MTPNQEKMFYKAIDNLKEATTEDEKNGDEGKKDYVLYQVRTENLLGDLYSNIDKACAIMSDFQQEYYFKDGLLGCHIDWNAKENKNLTKWVWEYERIMLHLDIVQDYVSKVLLALMERRERKKIEITLTPDLETKIKQLTGGSPSDSIEPVILKYLIRLGLEYKDEGDQASEQKEAIL